MTRHQVRIIFGGELQLCCSKPRTGFFRDGFCNTNHLDAGTHVICAVVTDAFLAFTRSQGNDLSTPIPEYGFPGLKAVDGWCLSSLRWNEAYEAGVSPPIRARSTHERALDFVDIDTLSKHCVDH